MLLPWFPCNYYMATWSLYVILQASAYPGPLAIQCRIIVQVLVPHQQNNRLDHQQQSWSTANVLSIVVVCYLSSIPTNPTRSLGQRPLAVNLALAACKVWWMSTRGWCELIQTTRGLQCGGVVVGFSEFRTKKRFHWDMIRNKRLKLEW